MAKVLREGDPRVFSRFPDLPVVERRPGRYIRSDIEISVSVDFNPVYLLFGWRRTKKLEPC